MNCWPGRSPWPPCPPCPPAPEPRRNQQPPDPPPTRPVGLAGTLYARTASGLVAVDLATGRQIREYGEAVPDAGWKRLHQLKDGRLRVLDLPSGQVRRETPVSGAQVKAVSRS
ncbi:hypothetical protein ACFWY5_47085 [Nonomuraea sp. NPDC059007]|uniref:hypothetical protein n=1 Tax=Nonomuraea sp. NPDC059007 TaxID=3346692 RepID=UPI003675374C